MATSYKDISPISSLSSFGQPITALSFDTVSDILWAGLNTGTITAYLGTRGVRGPSFRVGGDLGSWTKGGLNKWFFRPTTGNVVTFSNTSLSSNYLVSSLDNLEMIFLSPVTGAAIRKIPTASVLTHLELSHSMLISGSMDGYLRIHDTRTGMARGGGAENVTKAHARSIQGLETAGNFIFTIGMGERQSRPFPDPLVKIYDLRTMRPLPPIPFSAGPAFIHALPNRTSSIAIISNQGLINIVDVSNISAFNEFYQLDIATYITSTSISPSATYMAFGDAEGTIHLMSQAVGDTPFNGYEGQPVPWADTPSPLPDIQWTQST
ncbi:WD40-repeat-containing domain protein [Gymnopilus junonius]|uniref:WD40-repeat-containing domain protein n=1 Tax=Gymnopilus junonius TaxID=109634 RepID=A0A9P5NI76_GYMJU|nr:WD40-repeat-containing domain protein [Gymnopilus junonius]